MSLYSEIQKNPVKNLERKFIDLVRLELDIAAECATMHFEHDIAANPSAKKTKEELEKALSTIKSDLLTSIGELSNKDKYIYLLKVKEWLFDLVSEKDNNLNNEWHYQLNSTSDKAKKAFNKNMKIIQQAFKGELLLIYDKALKDLKMFHSTLLMKYEEGELTNQSPKEIAEYIITYKPQFTLSKDLTLQKLKGKEITTNLDKYQTALLFDLLRKKGAIINLKNSSLAHVISRLSPHSEQNLRTEGLDVIDFIKVDNPSYKNKNNNIPNQNLLAVKQVLTDILEEINEQIKTNSEKSSPPQGVTNP